MDRPAWVLDTANSVDGAPWTVNGFDREGESFERPPAIGPERFPSWGDVFRAHSGKMSRGVWGGALYGGRSRVGESESFETLLRCPKSGVGCRVPNARCRHRRRVRVRVREGALAASALWRHRSTDAGRGHPIAPRTGARPQEGRPARTATPVVPPSWWGITARLDRVGVRRLGPRGSHGTERRAHAERSAAINVDPRPEPPYGSRRPASPPALRSATGSSPPRWPPSARGRPAPLAAPRAVRQRRDPRHGSVTRDLVGRAERQVVQAGSMAGKRASAQGSRRRAPPRRPRTRSGRTHRPRVVPVRTTE